MRNILTDEFAWKLFANTGNVESYLIYKELNNLDSRIKTDEHNTDSGTRAENL